MSNIDNLHDELGFDGTDVEDDLINFSFDSIYENTLFSYHVSRIHAAVDRGAGRAVE